MSVEERIRDSLRQPLDGDREARDRAWEVVKAAAPQGTRTRRRQALPGRRALVALGAVALLIALAATPPGTAVSDWIRDGLGARDVTHRPSSPGLRSLPGGGELLVRSAGDAWVVHADGARRRLGPYSDATWSPNGLFVAAVRSGRQLVAVTPEGAVRWALTPADGVAMPRWAPSGLRIAYLSGGALRAVAGDGSGDAELAPAGGVVAPAWRPTGEDELAFADRRGRIVLVSAVTGRTIWRSGGGKAPVMLAWSPDGARVAAVARDVIRVFDGNGRLVTRWRAAPGSAFAAAAYSPRTRRLAVVERRPGGSAVRIASAPRRRPIFATAAPLRDLAWAPDGSWLLVTSPAADQWLFLRSRRPHRVVAVSRIATQLDPSARTVATPRISGWCCGR